MCILVAFNTFPFCKPKDYYIPFKESDIQSTEESEEDDVKDDSWFPGSEELTQETEEGDEERVEVEDGGDVVDSGVDESKKEEDEMEAEDMPPVAENDEDDGVFEGDVSYRSHRL